MKTTILNLALVATAAAAQPHGHGHGQFHQKKDASRVEKRVPDVVVTTIEAATETAYVIGGELVSVEDAEAGIKKGLYIVVGESTPTYSAPAAPSSTSVKVDAQFYQKSSTSSKAEPTTSSTSTSASSSTSTSSVVVPTTTSTTAAAATTTTAAATTTTAASTSSGTTGIDADFPSGKISCDHFPSDYGALAVDWLGTGGWSSIQSVPHYSIGDTAISYIVAAISGESCTPNSFCSYACPEGYVKTQWPEAQGATGQSIGGLYCNSNNKLELTRDSSKTLCMKGIGGVTIKNKMGDGVAVCRTDYPCSEAMVIPLWVDGGATKDLANINSESYYVWQGKPTTLQYYVNPKAVSLENGCVWNSPTNPLSAGNWAPVNIGVGQDSFGITYLSIFPNAPTTTAVLDFDIVISGDVSGTCSLKSGVYSQANGCTVGIPSGGNAVITFQASS